MELLKELLGFVVLSAPMFLFIVWLPLSVWAAAKVSKRYTHGSLKRKVSIGMLLFLAIFLMPFADGIAGRIYFNYLCATEAGVKVYKTVELPAEYWDEEGNARFLKPSGDLDRTMLGNRFGEPAVKKSYSDVFGIDEYHQKMVDNSTQDNLGEVIIYMYKGGWVSRTFNPTPGAIRCTNLRGNKLWRDFHLKLFKQSKFANK